MINNNHFMLWLVAIFLLCTIRTPLLHAQEKPQVASLKESVYSGASKTEESDFTRLGPPKPGEWLSQFPEEGQSFEQYRSKDIRFLKTAKRQKIVLQPLGNFSDSQRELLEALREYAHAYFQMPARIAKPVSLPDPVKSKMGRMLDEESRRDGYDRQYDAKQLVSRLLQAKLPDDAAIYLGITMTDLYAEDLNYVFGYGSFEARTGVYSLARYFPEFWGQPSNADSKRLALRRSFKVLNHEASHVFGLRHCIFYDCSMNGSNSLEEADNSSIHECPVCHQKLLATLQFDPEKRFSALSEIFVKHGFDEESQWLIQRSANWRKSR